jgi:hypothetical protein
MAEDEDVLGRLPLALIPLTGWTAQRAPRYNAGKYAG